MWVNVSDRVSVSVNVTVYLTVHSKFHRYSLKWPFLNLY